MIHNWAWPIPIFSCLFLVLNLAIALIHWASIEMEREVSKRPGNLLPVSQNKRPKTDLAPSRRTLSSAAVENTKSLIVPVASGSEFRIQQAKNFAVGQAKQDGCTGNFKILDSPFGNFLLPVIPSRVELAE